MDALAQAQVKPRRLPTISRRPAKGSHPFVSLRVQTFPSENTGLNVYGRNRRPHRASLALLDTRRQRSAPRQRTRPPQPPTHHNRHHRNTHQHHQQHTHTPATPPTPTTSTRGSHHPTVTINPPQPHRTSTPATIGNQEHTPQCRPTTTRRTPTEHHHQPPPTPPPTTTTTRSRSARTTITA